MSELVSIVMPVKNAAEFINATIESIQKQTHKNWELIAVNDSSSDLTEEFMSNLAKSDSRIQLLQNPGNGILDAINFGASQANGMYITRMDADDLMSVLRLEDQIQLLKRNPPKTIVTGPVKYFRQDKELGAGFKHYEQWLNNLCKAGTHYEHIYKECVIPSPSWLMRFEEFNEIGGFTGLNYPEDYDFVFRLYRFKFKVASVRDTVLFWRDHDARASRNLEVYSDQTFFFLKVQRFMELDRKSVSGLFLYGAGPKGKKLARELIANRIEFRWASGNMKKIGLSIYGIIIEDEKAVYKARNSQVIVAISSPVMKKDVVKKLKNYPEVYYFC